MLSVQKIIAERGLPGRSTLSDPLHDRTVKPGFNVNVATPRMGALRCCYARLPGQQFDSPDSAQGWAKAVLFDALFSIWSISCNLNPVNTPNV
jgi:hypothetical protein